MSKNPDLPEGWAMPDDLSKKINKVLNNKPITPEDELADALEDMARDIALIEPDPQDCAGWVMYLLEQMEAEAQSRGKGRELPKMLKSLIMKLNN